MKITWNRLLIIVLALFISKCAFAQDETIYNLPRTSTGTMHDLLIKEDSNTTNINGTQAITVADFIARYFILTTTTGSFVPTNGTVHSDPLRGGIEIRHTGTIIALWDTVGSFIIGAGSNKRVDSPKWGQTKYGIDSVIISINDSANHYRNGIFLKGDSIRCMVSNNTYTNNTIQYPNKTINNKIVNDFTNLHSQYGVRSHTDKGYVDSMDAVLGGAYIPLAGTGTNSVTGNIEINNGLGSWSLFSQDAYGSAELLILPSTDVMMQYTSPTNKYYNFDVNNGGIFARSTYTTFQGITYDASSATFIEKNLASERLSLLPKFINDSLYIHTGGLTAAAIDTAFHDVVITQNAAQTMYHKGIGITNTVTTLDGSGGFTIKNTTDNSKKVNFQIGNVPTGTTITVSTQSVGGTCAYLTDIPASYSLTAGGIYSALSYTPENVANKATDLSTNDNTHYPSTQATQTAINNAIAGVNPAISVAVATTTSLQAGYTYTNGVAGVGATITFTNTALIYDSYTLTTIGQRILVKNEGSAQYNGVYFVSVVGTGTLVPTIFTRALDFDQASDINNTGAIPVINGTLNGTTSWVVTSSVTTVGTDAVTFSEFSYNPTTLVTVAGTQTLTNKSISYSQITDAPSLTLTTTGTSTLATASGFSLNIPPIQAPLVQGTGISISSPTVSLSANALVWNESFIIDGLGSVIGTGTVICKYIPQSVHITGYAILEISSPPIATTTTVNFTSNAYTTYPPTSTITPTPILTAAKIAQNISITPVAIPSGNTIMIIITGNDLARKLQVVLIGTVD